MAFELRIVNKELNTSELYGVYWPFHKNRSFDVKFITPTQTGKTKIVNGRSKMKKIKIRLL